MKSPAGAQHSQASLTPHTWHIE